MKNILVKNSLKSILMSVLILSVIPATNSTLVCASLWKDCDKNFKAGFYEGNEENQNDNNNNDNANNNGNITNTNETTLGQPNEHPESGKADDSSKPLFLNIYDRSEAERDKYFPLRQILLKRQNEKQQNEEQEKPWYTDYSHLFRNESQ